MSTLRAYVLAVLLAHTWATGQALVEENKALGREGCANLETGAKKALEGLCAVNLGLVWACTVEDREGADALDLLGSVCKEVPEDRNCKWLLKCTKDPEDQVYSAAASMNQGYSENLPGASMLGGSMPSGSPSGTDEPTGSVQDKDCFDDPAQEKCKSVTYPDSAIKNDINQLCVDEAYDAMPWMIGCTFLKLCKDKKDGYCEPFVLLATLCADMPGMWGCQNYIKLCKTGSVVQQCKDGPIPKAPTTVATQRAILNSCQKSSMEGCSECPGPGSRCPDPMSTMAEMCHSMPSMKFCFKFEDFCAATNNAFKGLCLAESGFLPPMRMYFHQALRELVLFKKWIPYNNLTYAMSVLAIILIAVFAQFLRTMKMSLETHWYRSIKPKAYKQSLGYSSQGPQRGAYMSLPQFRRNLIRALLTGVTTTLDYALMLIAMTFNVGLFFAVVAGFVIGTLLFGHSLEREPGYKPLADQEDLDPGSAGMLALRAEAEGGCCGGSR